MARKNAVNRGKGVLLNGRLVSPRLLEKKNAREERRIRKSESVVPIGQPYVYRTAEKNLKYLKTHGLIAQ